MMKLIGITVVVALAGCGSKSPPASEPAAAASATRADDPWVGYDSWTALGTDRWVSKTHGKRFVQIYVNDIGLEAYKAGGETELPVGTVIVKPSWENQGGQPGAAGPVFVMEKKPAGFGTDGDWYYAFLWDQPTGKWADKGPIRWESPSDSVEYCLDCHDIYDRQLGGVPDDKRTW